MLPEPCHDLFAIGSIHADEKLVSLRAIDENIVLDPSSRIADHGILRMMDRHVCHVIGGHALQKRRGAFTCDGDSSHMTDVEQTCPGTYRLVFIDDAGVLDGHLPSGEINQLGVARLVVGK